MVRVFHYLTTHDKQARLFVLFCLTIVVGLSFFLIHLVRQRQFDATASLSRIRNTTVANQDAIFEGIKNQLREIVAAGGTSGAVELTNEAFAQGDINLINCHRLMHLIGHITQVVQTRNSASNDRTYFPELCGSGYGHGLEAQIVRTNALDFREQLYNLCKTAQTTSLGTPCYEGAGHAFMEETLDVQKATDLCDTLRPVEPNICYKGVFAQYASFIGGDDAETGGRYQGGPPLTLPTRTPIAYCASLSEKYRLICAHEVCAFGATSDITPALSQVTDEDYPIEMRVACIGNLAGARGEHELASAKTIAVPPMVLSFPQGLRRAYIGSSMWAFNEYNEGGAQKDWQRFCNTFPEESDRVFCAGLAHGA